MKLQHPTIAFTVGMFNAKDGPQYSVYTQAYGMQMSVLEWPLNILIMAPPHLIWSMTDAADVISAGMIPGASYTPGDGNYQQIRKFKGRWVLARVTDDVQRIIDEKLGVLLLIEKPIEAKLLAGLQGLTANNLIIALQISSTTTLEDTEKAVNRIRKKLAGECASAQIIISASFEHSDLVEYSSVGTASGLLMLDASFGKILDLAHKMQD